MHQFSSITTMRPNYNTKQTSFTEYNKKNSLFFQPPIAHIDWNKLIFRNESIVINFTITICVSRADAKYIFTGFTCMGTEHPNSIE